MSTYDIVSMNIFDYTVIGIVITYSLDIYYWFIS